MSDVPPLFIYLTTFWALCIGAAVLFNGCVGAVGISRMTQSKRSFWPIFAIGLFLAVAAIYQAAAKLRKSDLERQSAETARSTLSTQFEDMKSDLDARNEELSGGLAKLAAAAQLPAGQTSDQIVQGIIAKLPKAGAGAAANGSRTMSAAISTQSQTAGTQINVGGHNNIYVDSSGNRVIPEPIRQKMGTELAKAGSLKVNIIDMGIDPEVAQLGDQILEMVKDAGWTATNRTEVDGSHKPGLHGLILGVKDMNNLSTGARVLLHAFNTNDISLTIAADAEIKDSTDVNLIVGGRL
jgi:hypothetical protein